MVWHGDNTTISIPQFPQFPQSIDIPERVDIDYRYPQLLGLGYLTG